MKRPETVLLFITNWLCMLMCGVLHVNAMTDESVGSSCTRKCTMLDETPECWKQSVDFFTNNVQKALRDYAALVTNMHHWRENLADEKKSDMRVDLKNLEELSLNRTLGDFDEWDEEDQAPFNKEDLRAIFSVILNRTRSRVDDYVDPEIIPPSVSCPVSCEYYPYIWSTLSYVLVACLVLCCLIFFLHTCYTSRRLDKQAKVIF